MSPVPIDHALIVAAVLFSLGVIGLIARRNILFVLMSIEIMFNAAGLAFIAGGARWGNADGQVMFVLILAVAAAEVAVGLAIVLQLYHRFNTLDTDAARSLRG